VPTMKYFVFILSLSGAFIAPVFATEQTILTGTVTHVRDGDTIEVGKIPIRLHGVSAPELKLVNGKSVRCDLTGAKTYDRLVGTCYLEGKDIGISLIEVGLALDCPRYSGGRYAEFELTEARARIKLPGYCKK
jgi:micrococcal nuclease